MIVARGGARLQELDLKISTPNQAKEHAAEEFEKMGGTPGTP